MPKRAQRPAPTLATDRLLLRPPTLADVAEIARLANDFEVARWLSRVPHPYNEADARYYVTEVAAEDWAWLICAAADGATLGAVGLAPRPDMDAVELGYWLGRAYWGQGYATEAARAVVDHARTALTPSRIVAGHFVGNAASAAVLGKLGFVETGRSDRFSAVRDATLAHVDMQLPDSRDGLGRAP